MTLAMEDQTILIIFFAYLSILFAQGFPSVWLALKIGLKKEGVFNKSAAFIVFVTGELFTKSAGHSRFFIYSIPAK